MTKVCVSELAWNKYGSDLVAVGTTSGSVFVYDVQQNSPKSIFSVKGHDGKFHFYKRQHKKYPLGTIKSRLFCFIFI